MEFPIFSDALDDVRTSNDTRVTIDNNAAAISALAGLNEASGSWDQCLQVRPCCCALHTGQDCMEAWRLVVSCSGGASIAALADCDVISTAMP